MTGARTTGPPGREIVDLLPQRPPFRFVDVVDEVVPGERVVARYRLPSGEAFLAGHFPGNPVLPGVLEVEALAQAGAIAVLSTERFARCLPLLGGVDGARFRRRVVPGDELSLTVEVEHLSARAGRARGRATVEGEVACEARLMFVIAPDGEGRRST